MLIFKISTNVQQHFIAKHQDANIRFVYCGIQKVQKVSRTFLMLYHQLDDNDELEFSFGILARSLLMDMILMLKLKSIVSSYAQVSEELKEAVKQFCYSVVVMGLNMNWRPFTMMIRFLKRIKKELIKLLTPYSQMLSTSAAKNQS